MEYVDILVVSGADNYRESAFYTKCLNCKWLGNVQMADLIYCSKHKALVKRDNICNQYAQDLIEIDHIPEKEKPKHIIHIQKEKPKQKKEKDRRKEDRKRYMKKREDRDWMDMMNERSKRYYQLHSERICEKQREEERIN